MRDPHIKKEKSEWEGIADKAGETEDTFWKTV